ncbi:MAG: LysR family transcriptional regulator [Alteromonadaceae bacterium]|jgi:DNA-binding transcriptional LysR family regulator|uniref:LysR substrate-binding domain-containing protein n=3 Tax=Rheinheimera TaxID=67575 RepID=A0ABN1EE44_9GAMM|nr:MULTISPECIES: LysR family transcriptional regulator [Rheinheimera]MBJ91826.1 LysR family transcriptional regulator [Alteromonadaceae bacterium]MCB5215544.1 LysR family transcriptional regulator [Rheinheimera aquimaris]MCD1599541.1 LysR family transcriptional regulator [Rheinheimera aquimaris]HBN90833.1 LysR family transcriptional regulator [Rheinheimera sp.]|tara:strand:- start:1445 stop:2359 length:915 start_codon:yes stop_codon:yes gene_type:complete
MHNALSLDALRALDAIDRKGSFAAAAEALYKVPSALSYTIAKLEADLDVALFDRSKQKAQLTPAGQLLLDQGRALLHAANQLQNAVKQLDTGWETQFVIAKDSIVPNTPVLNVITQFLQLGKITQVRMTEEVMAGGWEALQTGRADIAVGLSGDFAKGQFTVLPMGEVEFVFAVAPHHQLAALDRIVSQEDVQQHTAVIVADSAIDAPKRSSGLFDTRQRVIVDNMQAKIAAQKQGLGIGFLPRHLISNELARGELIAKASSIPRDKLPLYLAWHKQSQGQALNWFSEHLMAVNWPQVFQPSTW